MRSWEEEEKEQRGEPEEMISSAVPELRHLSILDTNVTQHKHSCNENFKVNIRLSQGRMRVACVCVLYIG